MNNVKDRFWDPTTKSLLSQRQSQHIELMTLDSKRYIPQIREWLGDCRQNHKPWCSAQVPYLPTRVVTIDPLLERPRLYLSSPGERAPYVASSYCWGDFKGYTVTESLLDSWRGGLPVETMPQTIVDAITMTHSRGFQYLWVDALCIIQDSFADKAHEIGRMRDVYKNASLTIAAASSFSVLDGFLGVIQSPALGVRRSDGSISTIHLLRKEFGHTTEPLNRRAWALQESLLSRRLLTFASTQVHWCFQRPETVRLHPKSTDSPPHMPSVIFGVTSTQLHNFDLPQSVLWPRLVLEYSKRKLTYDTDRLLAIGRMASELAMIWNDTYLAGLWKNSIIPLLAWGASYFTFQDRVRPTDYQAPSWSWASVKSYGVYFAQVSKESLRFLTYKIELVDENSPYGQVK